MDADFLSDFEFESCRVDMNATSDHNVSFVPTVLQEPPTIVDPPPWHHVLVHKSTQYYLTFTPLIQLLLLLS